MRDITFDREDPQYDIEALQTDFANVIKAHKLDEHVDLPARTIAGFCIDAVQTLASAFELRSSFYADRMLDMPNPNGKSVKELNNGSVGH